ncbi:ATP-binding cassette domain-containing protein [Candidatus Bathyarchaeota archaeon]|nr:ATP-binding cassette domain-containing protein [Candidatus Bathyarchaeota archaeon]
MPEKLIEVHNLVKHYPVYSKGIVLKKQIGIVHAVDDVSFDIYRNETLGLVGESGCGKTTTAKLILDLETPTSGQVLYGGHEATKTFHSGTKEEKLSLRRKMQLVFQNPYSSLDPRMTVYDIVSEPFRIHGHLTKEKWDNRVYELLKMVGLEEYHAERYPHEFSGGQRQRVCIARALAVEPEFVVADEPISSLDVSIRAQILNLLGELQQRVGLTYLYISHDLSSVRQISHRVAVMYLGKIVEFSDTDHLFDHPVHPYTPALISAIPIPDPKKRMSRLVLSGEVPSPINPPTGCRFNPRCPFASAACKAEEPKLTDIGEGHLVACHQEYLSKRA